MGRYVLLEFEDTSVAQMFESNEYMPRQLGFRMLGSYARPTSFCDCPPKKRIHLDNWARGKRTGLWICRTCKKVTRYHRTGLLKRIEDYFGYNLMMIEPEDE